MEEIDIGLSVGKYFKNVCFNKLLKLKCQKNNRLQKFEITTKIDGCGSQCKSKVL